MKCADCKGEMVENTILEVMFCPKCDLGNLEREMDRAFSFLDEDK